jgi:hypothetical protein
VLQVDRVLAMSYMCSVRIAPGDLSSLDIMWGSRKPTLAKAVPARMKSGIPVTNKNCTFGVLSECADFGTPE